MQSRFWISWVVAVCAAGTVWALDASPELDRLLTSAPVWNESSADFMLAYTPMGFGYVSQQRDCARSIDKRLTFNGQRVWEALAYFETGTVKRIELSLYNRGDSGAAEEPEFRQLCKTLDDGLTRWAGNTINPMEAPTKDRANCITTKRTWIKAPSAAQLKFAYVEPRRQNGENTPLSTNRRVTPLQARLRNAKKAITISRTFAIRP